MWYFLLAGIVIVVALIIVIARRKKQEKYLREQEELKRAQLERAQKPIRDWLEKARRATYSFTNEGIDDLEDPPDATKWLDLNRQVEQMLGYVATARERQAKRKQAQQEAREALELIHVSMADQNEPLIERFEKVLKVADEDWPHLLADEELNQLCRR